MSEPATTPSVTADEDVTTETVIEAEDLVEEISIDGMCGVY
ncbi:MULTISPECIES: mycofactocin precursor MftA [Streptomyces]|uniref:Mycofactocin MftA n=1 Tax=Streptomyces doudnae TaxID=3075536 RepID=A0ABD5EXA1_9ACTN|nr:MULTISPECIES: mycofactocin precursor MftA [unclassified Streptomyces]MDT0438249.1 mycofactocin precursor MftA [Streptomyces sp. DSM 41981]MYQ66012.1 mycofactocin precursor [Streptomyces sp. SID4950]SCE12301.1 mycofactocin precursor [Streptomyces sp. SolWspMP-5a-2]